jgi:hypothetical protein
MRVHPTHITSVWSQCCECIFSFRHYLWGVLFGNWKSEADIKFDQSYCNVFSWSLSFVSWPINIKKLLQILLCGYNWELCKVLYNCYSLLVGMRWHQWKNCCSKWWTLSSVSCWLWSIHIGMSDTLTTRSTQGVTACKEPWGVLVRKVCIFWNVYCGM